MEFATEGFVVEGHSDATWNSDPDDLKLVTPWIFTLTRGAISWKSERQTCLIYSLVRVCRPVFGRKKGRMVNKCPGKRTNVGQTCVGLNHLLR